jgi:hypothetical protein
MTISVDDETGHVCRSASSLRDLRFTSCYVYSPGDPRDESRLLRVSVKTGCVRTLVDRAIRQDREVNRSPSLEGFFPAAAVLVPVPGSTPTPWGFATSSGRLAVALLDQGLGQRIWFGLRRIRAVRKSATAAPGARPSLRTHFDSMVIDPIQVPGRSHFVLIDDVVTRGRTLLAAAMRLREVIPQADIRGFALLRTMGYAPVVDRFLMPCTGKIEWKGNDVRRSP